jgi:hypothetical protein
MKDLHHMARMHLANRPPHQTNHLPSKLKMHSLFVLFSLVTAQSQWHRRFYYDDRTCAGKLSLGVHVFLAGTCASTSFACEQKSPGTPSSSESTGCSSISSFSPDPVFTIPSGSVSGTYMTLNQFYTADCTLGSSVEQNTFAADGKCYAVETENSFFKATCSGTTAQLDICSDAACTKCGGATLLNAGSFQSTSIKFASSCGRFV